MRFWRFILFILIVGGLGWFVMAKMSSFKTATPTPSESAVAQFIDRPKVSPLKIYAELASGDSTRVLSCYHGVCTKPAAAPAQVNGGVTNGQDWYFYTSDTSAKAGKITSTLNRLNLLTNKQTPVVASTDLTSPRETYLSPDGKHVAFFSDNISDPSKQLSELWVYDSESNNVQVVAEKLYRPDIRSGVHWNSSSTCLWFLVNTAVRPNEHLDLEVVTLQPVKAATPFSKIDWPSYAASLDSMVLDINSQGTKIAMAAPGIFGQTSFLTADEGMALQRINLRGAIPSIQWIEGGVAVYAVQDSSGFTFWREENGHNRFVAHQPGTISSARSNAKGDYITFIVPTGNSASHLYSLHTKTGTVIDEGALPYSKDAVRLVKVAPEQSADLGQPNVTQTLDDSELAAFLDKHFGEIIGKEDTHPLRFLVTSETNTIYVSYRLGKGAEERILLQIKDAINVEWSILARYQAVNGDWQKVEGGDVKDPQSLRLYEWEDSLKRWILKNNVAG